MKNAKQPAFWVLGPKVDRLQKRCKQRLKTTTLHTSSKPEPPRKFKNHRGSREKSAETLNSLLRTLEAKLELSTVVSPCLLLPLTRRGLWGGAFGDCCSCTWQRTNHPLGCLKNRSKRGAPRLLFSPKVCVSGQQEGPRMPCRSPWSPA